MLKEIFVDLDEKSIELNEDISTGVYGKTLAVNRVIDSGNPDRIIYVSGYTPMAAAGLGFAGKMNLYGISLLGGNLQGSRCGGLFTKYLTSFGIIGIQITGDTVEKQVMIIDESGNSELVLLNKFGENIKGTEDFIHRLYKEYDEEIGVAVVDPSSTDFMYNAVVCNTKKGDVPNHAAGRGTTIFGRNGLVGIVVKKPKNNLHKLNMDRKKLTDLLRKITAAKKNINLAGSASKDNPLFGGTYGGAAKGRFDFGHGLTNLFRSANVPDEYYDDLLPDTMVHDQIKIAEENNLKIHRHSCTAGCPNKCVQFVFIQNENNEWKRFKAGEWETFQGVINLGIFKNVMEISSYILEHSNKYAYDHIEALVTLAALALVSEIKTDTGVRYGDKESILSALHQAAEGDTELGRLIRKGAAAVEEHYDIERHFTVGGHAMPFHNGRSFLQTGVGLSWTYGRHGEACAGPGRHNFLGEAYDPADHTIDPKIHIKNTMHAMTMYGAIDDNGLCFFMGPSVDTLVDLEMLYDTIGVKADVRKMIRDSANTILKIYEFNKSRGVNIRPLPKHFYEHGTYGNKQTEEDALPFNVPFELIKTYGFEVLNNVASGCETVPETLLEKSKSRYK